MRKEWNGMRRRCRDENKNIFKENNKNDSNIDISRSQGQRANFFSFLSSSSSTFVITTFFWQFVLWCVYMCVCVCVCLYVCVFCVCVCMNKWVCVYVYVSMSASVSECECECVVAQIYFSSFLSGCTSSRQSHFDSFLLFPSFTLS